MSGKRAFLSIFIFSCLRHAASIDVGAHLDCVSKMKPLKECDGTDIALKKPAYLSSTGWGGTPEKANDGDPNTYAHSVDGKGQSYLVIDLQARYLIHHVRVRERLQGHHGFFSILVSDSFDPADTATGVSNFQVCGEQRAVADKSAFLEVPCHRFARFVALERFNRNYYIIIGDFEVYGVETGALAYKIGNLDAKTINYSKVLNMNPTEDKRFDKARDRNKSTCQAFLGTQFPIVIDMGATVMQPKLRLFTEYGVEFFDFSLGISDNFSDCKRYLIKQFRPCAKVTTNKKEAGLCRGTGRYLSFTRHMTPKGYIWICYIDVTGRKLDIERNVTIPEPESTCEALPNLARGKPAFQSSLNWGGVASRAVDGNTDGTYNNRHCSHTHSTANAWWFVDLGDYYDITTVRVWPRTESHVKSFVDVSVSLGMLSPNCGGIDFSSFLECHRRVKFVGQLPIVANCRGLARYVAVRNINRSTKSLVLCEVEVFGSERENFSEEKFPWKSACDLNKDDNRALGKTFYNAPFMKEWKFADGDLAKGSWTLKQPHSSVLLDLEAKVKGSVLRLHRLEGEGIENGLEILIGNECTRCSLDDIDAFLLAGQLNSINEAMTEFVFAGHEFRFILIRSKSPKRTNFFIGEVEVFSYHKPTPVSAQSMSEWKERCRFRKDRNRNFAFGAPAQMAGGGNAGAAVDGIDTLASVAPNGWIVVNLEKIVKVSGVLLWAVRSFDPKAITNTEVRILHSFNPCHPELHTSGVPCENVRSGGIPYPRLVRCRATGQFVAVFKHKPDENDLEITEIQVQGEVTSEKPTTKPPMPNLKGTISVKDSPRGEILRGVSEWSRSSKASQVIPVLKKSFPLINSDKRDVVIMATSTIGKGKVVVSGEDEHVTQLSQRSTTLMQNLAKWMANGATPHFHKVADLLRDKDHLEKPGCIILWKMTDNVSKKTADLVRDFVTSGKASLILAGKRWTLKGNLESYTWHSLYLETGVLLSSHIVNNFPTPWRIDNVPLVYSLPLELQLDLLVASTDVFLDAGSSLLPHLNKVSPKILKAIGASDKLSRLADIYEQQVLMSYPCVSRRTVRSEEKQLMAAFGQIMLSQGLAFSNRKAPGAEYFPGDVPRATDLEDVTKVFDGATGQTAHATGRYLPPGGTMEISSANVESEKELSNWYIRVGSQKNSYSFKGEWFRFPVISVKVPATSGRIFSGFGGLVWMENEKRSKKIKLILKGTAKAPSKIKTDVHFRHPDEVMTKG